VLFYLGVETQKFISLLQSVAEEQNENGWWWNWLVQYGTRGKNTFHFALRIFILVLCIVVSYLRVPSSQHFSPFSVNEIIYVWSCSADTLITLGFSWRCCVCYVVWSVSTDSICIVTKWKGIEWDITELMLESDWIIFIANDTDTVTQITLLTQAAHIGLTELTVHLLLHAVHGFMGVQWVMTDSSIPYYWKLYPT
jgi:hypothetical protein